MRIKTESEVEVTPDFLAEAFFQMDNEEQRVFFESVAKKFKGKDFDTQMFYAADGMSDDGREVMETIGKNANRLNAKGK